MDVPFRTMRWQHIFFFSFISNKAKQNAASCSKENVPSFHQRNKLQSQLVHIKVFSAFQIFYINAGFFNRKNIHGMVSTKEVSQLSESNRRPAHYEGAAL